MSQVGNALTMLILLKSRGKMKIKELADILEVDERTVRRYKEDLTQANIYIESETGKYGGYCLKGFNYLYGLNVTETEMVALKIVHKHLADSNHPILKDFLLLYEKIRLIQKDPGSFQNLEHYMKKGSRSIKSSAEEKKFIDIHSALITRQKVRMQYLSLNSGLKERIVHPYALYHYKGEMYFAGYCETRCEVIDFKLCRVGSYGILEDRFIKKNDFNLDRFMKDCIGIYKDDELLVKLHITFPMSQIIREKIWVENQKIVENEDQSIIYEARMRGLPEVKSWILGMGSSVQVLEPDTLRNEVMEEIKKLMKKYE